MHCSDAASPYSYTACIIYKSTPALVQTLYTTCKPIYTLTWVSDTYLSICVNNHPTFICVLMRKGYFKREKRNLCNLASYKRPFILISATPNKCFPKRVRDRLFTRVIKIISSFGGYKQNSVFRHIRNTFFLSFSFCNSFCAFYICKFKLISKTIHFFFLSDY